MNRKDLFKMSDAHGFIRKSKNLRPKLRIFKDGTIIRADINLELCKKMTIKEAIKLLK